MDTNKCRALKAPLLRVEPVEDDVEAAAVVDAFDCAVAGSSLDSLVAAVAAAVAAVECLSLFFWLPLLLLLKLGFPEPG